MTDFDDMLPFNEHKPSRTGLNIAVLLVDDEPSHCDIGRALLGENGFYVRTALSLCSAISILKNFKIDVVISDVHMPNGSGFDLLREIKKLKGIRPTVFLASGLAKASTEELRRLGAIELLDKPLDYDLLGQKIILEYQKRELAAKGTKIDSSFHS